MSIEVKMNLGAINQALLKNAKATRVAASDVLRFEMGSLIKTMQVYTPPHKKGSDKINEDKKLGWDSVATDIRKIIKEENATDEQWITLKGLGTQAYKFTAKSGAVYAIDQDHYWPTASNSKLEQHHNKHRNKNGKVTTARGGSPVGRNSMDIGRWKGVEWVHTKPAIVARYIKFKQKSVGKLKAGWNNAMAFFKTKNPPLWVKRHGTGSGSATDKIKSELFTGWLGATNKIGWASIINRKQIIPFVVKMHQAIIDNEIKKVVGNAVKRFNAQNPAPTEVIKVAA